jgi:excinuclease ABC subunit B
MPFELVSKFKPTGDQPQAIKKLSENIKAENRHNVLLGVTGSGKTFTLASVIEKTQRPTLWICHNKTLAAQLYTEFKEFFPENAVEYFVSYYDYYQPEAYVPSTDTYIEKDSDINEQIEKMRMHAVSGILSRGDTIIVASISCIYGLGNPDDFKGMSVKLAVGKEMPRQQLLHTLVDMQYERNDIDFTRGRFRIRGDTLEIQPAYEEIAVRVEFWGDEIERIVEVDPLTGEIVAERSDVDIYPAKHFVTSYDKLTAAIADIEVELKERLEELRGQDKVLEAARLEARTNYDLEMLREAVFDPRRLDDYLDQIERMDPAKLHQYEEATGVALARANVDFSGIQHANAEAEERRLMPRYVEDYFRSHGRRAEDGCSQGPPRRRIGGYKEMETN